MVDQPKIVAYILAKNEEPNIGKCLRSLQPCGIPVVLLDSGSTDRTIEIARQFPFCEVRDYRYIDHATAYNGITTNAQADSVLILDADMEVSCELWSEVLGLASHQDWQVVCAPIRMHVDGWPLYFGSLYPPKAFLFRVGEEYFVPRGHGESLRSGLGIVKTRSRLIHNDLKPYEEYLRTQVRYGNNLARRCARGELSFKDRLRATSPIMAFVYPFVSLVIYGGLLCGRRGIIYALDRAIAVLVQWRVVLASREAKDRQNDSRKI